MYELKNQLSYNNLCVGEKKKNLNMNNYVQCSQSFLAWSDMC